MLRVCSTLACGSECTHRGYWLTLPVMVKADEKRLWLPIAILWASGTYFLDSGTHNLAAH